MHEDLARPRRMTAEDWADHLAQDLHDWLEGWRATHQATWPWGTDAEAYQEAVVVGLVGWLCGEIAARSGGQGPPWVLPVQLSQMHEWWHGAWTAMLMVEMDEAEDAAAEEAGPGLDGR